jgi:hypothetical protein
MAYAQAEKQFFDWCEDRRLWLDDIEPIVIGVTSSSSEQTP